MNNETPPKNQEQTAKKIIKGTEKFYSDIIKIKNHRYKSWEHCYQCFHQAIKEGCDDKTIDDLSLQLSFYLASWGMYRGSSFLLQRDYQVHKLIIKEILKPEYKELLDLDCRILLSNEKIQNSLENLSNNLKQLYNDIRTPVNQERNVAEVKNNVSNVLITKVLLGTLGCVPAYDRFFVDAIKKERITTGNYNLKSILELSEFYKNNYDSFEKSRKTFKINGKEEFIYPQMKFLDMGLWQIGFDIDNSKKESKS